MYVCICVSAAGACRLASLRRCHETPLSLGMRRVCRAPYTCIRIRMVHVVCVAGGAGGGCGCILPTRQADKAHTTHRQVRHTRRPHELVDVGGGRDGHAHQVGDGHAAVLPGALVGAALAFLSGWDTFGNIELLVATSEFKIFDSKTLYEFGRFACRRCHKRIA